METKKALIFTSIADSAGLVPVTAMQADSHGLTEMNIYF